MGLLEFAIHYLIQMGIGAVIGGFVVWVVMSRGRDKAVAKMTRQVIESQGVMAQARSQTGHMPTVRPIRTVPADHGQHDGDTQVIPVTPGNMPPAA